MDIPRRTKEDLKQLVRDYVAGQVLFSSEIRDPHMVGMVFFPIMMGALSYGVAAPVLPPEPVKPVRGFARPKRPLPDYGAAKAGREAAMAEAREVLTRAEFRARWGEGGESEVHEARVAFELARDALADALSEAEAVADAALGVAMVEYRALLGEYSAALREYRTAMVEYRTACEGMSGEVAAWELGKAAHQKSLEANLGVIYGYHRDAVGGRAINGYPMLGSCWLLHREDWDVVKVAIDRELSREIEL